MTLTNEAVLEAIRPVKDPELGKSFVELGMVKDVAVHGGAVHLTVDLTTPGCPLKAQIAAEIERAARTLPGVEKVDVQFTATVSRSPTAFGKENLIPTVKNVILVASGKGGVGKSTVAVNVAVALQRLGARVGLLDADIYGPSVPTMTGLRGRRPSSADGKKLEPIEAFGLKIMSIGFFVDPEQAMVWRGPMLHSAIIQFFRDVNWGEIDYLVLDLPPGTGDVQLTISQQVSVAGAVVVTTPQDVALADAIKAKAMFDKVEIPVLGIVENMSFFVCPHCGRETDIFSRGGGRAMAEKLGVPFLGEIPLHTAVRESGDEGVPIVAREPDGQRAQAFVAVAQAVTARVSVHNFERRKAQGPFNILQGQPRV